jgi:hypothetical protein
MCLSFLHLAAIPKHGDVYDLGHFRSSPSLLRLGDGLGGSQAHPDAQRYSAARPMSQSAYLNQYLETYIPLYIEDPQKFAVCAEHRVLYSEGLAVSGVSFNRRREMAWSQADCARFARKLVQRVFA